MKKLTIIYILAILLMVKKMDMAPKNGKIKPDMKVNGKIIDLMDMEFIIFLVGKNILENGKIVVKMDLENTVVLMAKNM